MTDEEFLIAWDRLSRERRWKLLAEFESRLRSADEQELAGLRQRAAEIEARMAQIGNVQRTAAPPKPPRAPSPLDETDAGNGVREIETNVSASAFRNELQTLRAQNVARRRRRGLEH